jgi:large subunit ribosomal protein L28e
MVKRNGRTARTGAIRFSSEAGNVASLSTFKYSGLANSRTIDVTSTASKDAKKGADLTMLKKTSSKAGSKPAKATQSTPLNKCFRSSVSAVEKQSARADLTAAAKAKYTGLANGKKAAKGLRKMSKVTLGRGTQ